ncbi:MAG: M55 family metallopeptidase [Gemmatimonadales bacterium]
MIGRIGLLLGWMLAVLPGVAAGQRGVKVFISVDMEGLAGVVNGPDVDPRGPDYGHFREIMAGETNAAIEGAFRAGATEVLVRDSHGAKNNLLPERLDPRAKLLRGVSVGPRNMMEGIDSSFDAVVFLGYHARAGTPNAILEHTSTGNVIDFSVNGISLPEAGYNSVVAGLAGVPVVFIAGDRAVVDQVRGLLGAVDGVAVKQEINDAVISLSPRRAQEEVQRGVEQAVRNRSRFKPYVIPAPYTMVLKVRKDRELYPGSRRVKEGETTFSSPDFLEILNAFNAMK